MFILLIAMRVFNGFLPTFLFAFVLLSGVHAQNSTKSGFGAAIEAGGLVSSTENTPFWLRTGQFGIIPTHAPAGIVQASVYKKYVFFDSLLQRPRKLDWNAGISPVATYDKQDKSRLVLPEAYASVRFRNTELYVGRRRELMGVGDSTLSSGFYSGSGNALPIPKIQIGTLGFTPLKFTRDFLSIHARFAHGWFNTAYLDGVRLHQKFLYFRLGKPKSATKIIFGLNHNVLWAGHSEYLKQHP
jgi:hypothetical protein